MQSGSLGLTGKVAVVTGGSRGIGRAVVDLLSSFGAKVVVNFVRDEQAATHTVALARERGAEAVAIQADVSQLTEASRLVDETLEHFGRIDFLICNAGIWEGAPVESISEELWDRTIEINLKGTWTVCRETVPVMKQQKFGRIVIVSSTAGQRGEANVSNYAASKGAQIAFMKSLSTELGPFGINVNCVAPGWVDTDMTTAILADKTRIEAIVKEIPKGRVATPDDIAGPVVFLCSTWADHITGSTISVNGGSVL
ncbi:MAG TPA: SDR family NAD(P)-dependent oxidoreductase [Pyrinomonadaceae bacterium]|nr:SDR family NAD(P)-dependent oxidoreductase [Pyrinomonadaceae bacterium]